MADWIIYIRSEAICRLKPFPLQVCGLHSRILMESKNEKNWKKLEDFYMGSRKSPANAVAYSHKLYIHFFFFKWSEKFEIKMCLKSIWYLPPQDKNKIGTKWQYDLSWSYHLLNQHQRDVWNAGVSFCVDKTCLREPPFPQYTTPRSDREQRRYLDLRCYPQSDLAVPRMQLFFAGYADEIFSSLLFSLSSFFIWLGIHAGWDFGAYEVFRER